MEIGSEAYFMLKTQTEKNMGGLFQQNISIYQIWTDLCHHSRNHVLTY